MEATISNLQRKKFPSLPQNVVKKIYLARHARLKLLMDRNIPNEIRWLIEAKVRLAGEFPDSLVKSMPGMGKSSFAKKKESKKIRSLSQVCTMDL